MWGTGDEFRYDDISISWDCVKNAGKKKRTPRGRCRLGRKGVRGTSSRSCEPANEAKRLLALRTASKSRWALLAWPFEKASVCAEISDATGEDGLTSKGSNVSSSLGDPGTDVGG